MYNCKFSPEQNERNEKIQAVAERALRKMSYVDIAKELNIKVEDVEMRLAQLQQLNPKAYETVMQVRSGKI